MLYQPKSAVKSSEVYRFIFERCEICFGFLTEQILGNTSVEIILPYCGAHKSTQ